MLKANKKYLPINDDDDDTLILRAMKCGNY